MGQKDLQAKMVMPIGFDSEHCPNHSRGSREVYRESSCAEEFRGTAGDTHHTGSQQTKSVAPPHPLPGVKTHQLKGNTTTHPHMDSEKRRVAGGNWRSVKNCKWTMVFLEALH